MGFAQKIAGIRPGYLARTELRFVLLRARIGRSDDAAALLADVRAALHDLAGTAPVMGFKALGAMARRLEAGLAEDAGAVDLAQEFDLILAEVRKARQCG